MRKGGAENEEIIETAVIENGHPDHIGTANYFREKYGVKIYASVGERAWIENIDLQFAMRPMPNFYNLAGQSTIVDQVVKDGDKIYLSDDTYIEVIGTPGHSADEVSYRIGDVVFIGDTVPVRGDIPTNYALSVSIQGCANLYKANSTFRRYKINELKVIIILEVEKNEPICYRCSY